MGRLRLACAVLFALVASTQLWSSHGGQEPAGAEPSASYIKGWSDWAQGKLGSFGGKKSEEPPAAAAGSGWSDWAYQKMSSFSNFASKDAKKAAQAGGQSAGETWEGTKEGVKHGSDKGAAYVDKASEAGQDAAEKLKQETEL